METWTLSWSKLLEFNQESVNKLTDGLVGAFRISRIEGEKVIVFYVGSSQDIKNDLLKLLSDNDGSECVKAITASYKCYFRYSLVKNQDVRSAVTRKMFKIYQPSCNSEEPIGRDDIEVNIN